MTSFCRSAIIEQSIQNIDDSSDSEDFRVKYPSSLITDDDGDDEDDEEYDEESEVLYYNSINDADNSYHPQGRQRKQQIQHINRDDHFNILTTEEYLEMEHQPRNRNLKGKLYMLNPEDFPEDPIKQQQIRRAKVTHDHHKRKSKETQRLRIENEKLQKLVRIYKKREKFLRWLCELCTCHAVTSALSKTQSKTTAVPSRPPVENANSSSVVIRPLNHHPRPPPPLAPAIMHSSFQSTRTYSKERPELKQILPRLTSKNAIETKPKIFSISTPPAPLFQSPRPQPASIDSNYSNVKCVQAANPSSRKMPNLRPILQKQQPVLHANHAQLPLQLSRNISVRPFMYKTLQIPQNLTKMAQMNRENTKVQVPVAHTITATPAYPLFNNTAITIEKTSGPQSARMHLKLDHKTEKVKKHINPLLRFQKTLNLINNIVEQSKTGTNRANNTKTTESQKCGRNGKRPSEPAARGQKTPTIESLCGGTQPTHEILRYWSDEIIPLPPKRRVQQKSQIISSIGIPLADGQNDLQNEQTQRRSKRSAATSRLSTAELLGGVGSKLHKIVNNAFNTCPSDTPEPPLVSISEDVDAESSSDLEGLDWNNIEIQYVRPRQLYALCKSSTP
ncbi:uncharacterized protein LOC118434306 [Folsomia candida]|uniref:uncharacterized protein LOC118434306 n=1 Tax=Folsomia candida TaxID=158441 RepID=UPI0016054925|nr:uncharacterized protein LOC118434306 [Folsomia candida]XP_035703362.1 uncharacterized protein LOC118434306 [Folsomia candida]XP_035703363.1 uncharacterized protein LOC118434306 [Folsomia candida]